MFRLSSSGLNSGVEINRVLNDHLAVLLPLDDEVDNLLAGIRGGQRQLRGVWAPGVRDKVSHVDCLLAVLSQELIPLASVEDTGPLISTLSQALAGVHNCLDMVESTRWQAFEMKVRVFLCVLLEWNDVHLDWKSPFR